MNQYTIQPAAPEKVKFKFNFIDFVGKVIFASRLLLSPMYLGMFAALAVYNWLFFREVWYLVSHVHEMQESDALLIVIGLIDMTMIANLIDMTMVGGYSIFVREYDYDKLKDKPRWMHGFNTTAQKAKMAMSLIAIAGVYQLKDFIQVDDDSVTWDHVLKRTVMAATFIAFGIAYGVIARITPHDNITDDHAKEHH